MNGKPLPINLHLLYQLLCKQQQWHQFLHWQHLLQWMQQSLLNQAGMFLLTHVFLYVRIFSCTCLPSRLPLPLQIGNPFKNAFAAWVERCNLSPWLQMHLWEPSRDDQRIARLPLIGMTAANPEADVSHHGRSYNGHLWHGTCFSQLASIVSAGTLLRCSVPTRNYYAIWAAQSRDRALQYSPPVLVGGIPVQCVLLLQASRVKGSHFKTADLQLTLRECWQTVLYVYIIKHRGESTFRYPHSFGRWLPKFDWNPSFSNWNPLPQQWQVVTNTGAAADAASRVAGVPEIPIP